VSLASGDFRLGTPGRVDDGVDQAATLVRGAESRFFRHELEALGKLDAS
jgi:hypothetical protein